MIRFKTGRSELNYFILRCNYSLDTWKLAHLIVFRFKLSTELILSGRWRITESKDTEILNGMFVFVAEIDKTKKALLTDTVPSENTSIREDHRPSETIPSIRTFSIGGGATRSTVERVLRRYMRRACRRGGQKNEEEAWRRIMAGGEDGGGGWGDEREDGALEVERSLHQ